MILPILCLSPITPTKQSISWCRRPLFSPHLAIQISVIPHPASILTLISHPAKPMWTLYLRKEKMLFP